MRLKGCNIDKYKVKWFTEDFRGCVATKNIKSGEEVVRMKHNCILVDTMAHKHPLLKDYKVEDNKEYRYLLAIFVHLERKNPDSVWKDYLATWPKSVDEFPEMFNEAQMAEIKGTELEQYVKFGKQLKQDQYKLVCSKIPHIAEHISEKEYIQTLILMESRTFKYPDGHIAL